MCSDRSRNGATAIDVCGGDAMPPGARRSSFTTTRSNTNATASTRSMDPTAHATRALARGSGVAAFVAVDGDNSAPLATEGDCDGGASGTVQGATAATIRYPRRGSVTMYVGCRG